MKTTRLRSMAKALTWMTVATITGFILVYLLTQDLTLGLVFATVNFTVKSLLYYLHERGWDVVKWGKVSEISPEKKYYPHEEPFRVDLFDHMDSSPTVNDLEVGIVALPHGIGIGACNTGTASGGGGFDDSPIWVENQEGNLIVHLWSDINIEDYTHRVDMRDAMQSNWDGEI